MKKLSKFEITAVILGPIVLLPLVYLYIFVLTMFGPSKAINIEIEKEYSAIRGKGEPVTLKELVPAKVPESENGAFAYEKAFEKVGEIPKEVEVLLSRKPSELTSEERSSIRRFLDNNEEGFYLLEKAITYKQCRFPIDYEQGLLAELSHLTNLRKCARLLALKSLWELGNGNSEEAVSTSLQMMSLVEALSTESFLLSQLVRVAISSIMVRSLQKIILEDDSSRETLMSLMNILNTFQEEMKSGLKLAFCGERCLFIALFKSPEKYLTKEIGFDVPLIKVKYFMDSRFMKGDELYGMRMYKRIIGLTEVPLHEAIKDSKELMSDFHKGTGKVIESLGVLKPWRMDELHIFSAMLLPSFEGAFEIWARHKAETEEVRIAAALEIYRMESSLYPKHLQDIPSQILSPMPKDPFTGEDFIYTKEGDGFILYSVGQNLKDDGGIPRSRKRNEKAYTDYDIVLGN